MHNTEDRKGVDNASKLAYRSITDPILNPPLFGGLLAHNVAGLLYKQVR